MMESMSKAEGLSVRVVTNGGHLGQALFHIDDSCKCISDYIGSMKSLIKHLLQDNEEVKSVELFVEYPEFNDKADALRYNLSNGYALKDKDGYVKL